MADIWAVPYNYHLYICNEAKIMRATKNMHDTLSNLGINEQGF
jgi:hypothetical protein